VHVFLPNDTGGAGVAAPLVDVTVHSEEVIRPVLYRLWISAPDGGCRGILGSAMARPLRLEFSNALYHITSRGNERRPIFRTIRDRQTVLGMATRRFGWSLTAWVLMTNHFHLVLKTPEPNLSKGMHWLNSTYANWFNRIHGRCGHLFQGRFKAFLIDEESYFADVLRYVVLNPVRAKMCERPKEYRWSSYRATAGVEDAPDWLDLAPVIGCSVPTPQRPSRSIANSFLQRSDARTRLWDKLTNQFYLGSDAWVEDAPADRNQAALDRSSPNPTRGRQAEDAYDRQRGGEGSRRDSRINSLHAGTHPPKPGSVAGMARGLGHPALNRGIAPIAKRRAHLQPDQAVRRDLRREPHAPRAARRRHCGLARLI
jgi:putative transposase